MKTLLMFFALLPAWASAGEPIFPSSHYVKKAEEKVAAPQPALVTFEKPASVLVEKKVHGHSHRCPFDGTVWSHDDHKLGDVAAHQCPKCHRIQWDKYQENVTITQQVQQPAAVVASPVIVKPRNVFVQQNCPNGQCPLQRQPTYFFRR